MLNISSVFCHAYCRASAEGFCTLHLCDMDHARLTTTVWAQAPALANMKKCLSAWLRSEPDYSSTLPDWITFVRDQLLHLRLARLVPCPQAHNIFTAPWTPHIEISSRISNIFRHNKTPVCWNSQIFTSTYSRRGMPEPEVRWANKPLSSWSE